MKQILDGVKIVDFGLSAAMPVMVRELAEHGATAIRVECHRSLDTLRVGQPYKDAVVGINRAGWFMTTNANKYGISLDLNSSRGPEVARRLVEWADIVCEGMIPGVMERWGLGYEDCRKINPDIIYISSCLYGDSGPYAKQPGYGNIAAALAGFDEVTGWPDRPPAMLYGAYTDYTTPYYGICIVMGALARRGKTGKGMYVDQSQMESGLTLLAPAILDYTVNGRIATRMGNRDPYAAPHGCYPCSGNDRWCVIAVTNEDQWNKFCQAIGNPEWAQESRFATMLGRKENEDDLDELIAGWTADHTPEEVMTLMQANGVPAGMVMNTQNLVEDPQLKARQHFRSLKHTEIGEHLYQSPAYRLSKTPCHIWKAGPCLGEDNEHVYKNFLGYSDDEIAELLIEGVITTDSDLPSLSTLA